MKFYGVVGFGEAVEIRPGVYDDVVSERSYQGDVLRNTRRLQEGAKVNDNITIGNSISIVADQFALEHLFAMRYVYWSGTRWKLADIQVETPRLIFRLGGVYNGPTPAPGTP